MKLTILGKNSVLYKSLRSDMLKEYKVKEYSHSEVHLIEEGAVCIIFSLAPSLQENISLINKLTARKIEKIIYISTSAIYSFAKGVGSGYPDLKRKIENYLLNKVKKPVTCIRLGIPEYKWGDYKLTGKLAITGNSQFMDALRRCYCGDEPVIDCFEVETFKSSLISKSYRALYDWFPSKTRILLLPLILLLKFSKHLSYGYTLESSLFFASNNFRVLVAGNGLSALGVHLALHDLNSEKCVISLASSDRSDVSYLKSVLEYGKFGNSNFWHGVLSRYAKGDTYEVVRLNLLKKFYKIDEFRKNWSFVPFRPIRPKNHIKNTKNLNIHRFVTNSDKVFVYCEELVIPVDELILCLGVFGSISVLYNSGVLKDGDYTLDDHSVGYLGQLRFDDKRKHGNDNLLLRRNGYFRKNFKIGGEFSGVIRPAIGRFLDINYAIKYRSFYARKSSTIITNLLKKLNVALLLEAVYNKFGVQLVKSKYYNMFGHFVVKDAVKVVLRDNMIEVIDVKNSIYIDSNMYRESLEDLFPNAMEIDVTKKVSLSPGIHFVNLKQAGDSLDVFTTSKNVHVYSSASLPSLGPEHISLDLMVESYQNYMGNAKV